MTRRIVGPHRKTGRKNAPLTDRLMTKIAAGENGCWIWTGAIGSHGYGHFSRRDPGSHLAHRAVYEHLRESVPAGLVLDHLCRNVRCVNPDHLEAVTQRENLIRSHNFMSTRLRVTEVV